MRMVLLLVACALLSTACEPAAISGRGFDTGVSADQGVAVPDNGGRGNDTSADTAPDSEDSTSHGDHGIEMPPLVAEWKQKIEEAPWDVVGENFDPTRVLSLREKPEAAQPRCPKALYLLDISPGSPSASLCIDEFTTSHLSLSLCKYDASQCAGGWQVQDAKLYEKDGERILYIKWSAGKVGEDTLLQQ